MYICLCRNSSATLDSTLVSSRSSRNSFESVSAPPPPIPPPSSPSRPPTSTPTTLVRPLLLAFILSISDALLFSLPAFVAGSAEIAREGSQKQSQKHHLPPSSNGSRNDEDDEGSLELDMDDVLINGASSSSNPQREGRSVSSTVHDRGSGKPKPSLVPAPSSSHPHRTHHQDRSSSKRQQEVQPPQQAQAGARDSFLNYFFGGQPGSESAPSSVLGGLEANGQFGARAGGNGGRTDYLPDLSKVRRFSALLRRRQADGPLLLFLRARDDSPDVGDWKGVAPRST